MATLALSVAGQFVGGLVGGPFGATIGRALGALAGSAVDGALFGAEPQRAASNDLRVQGSSEGGAVPRLYGWSRLSGNIIWARELELLGDENAGAKGMPRAEEDEEIGASFAVAFCEGQVHRLGRVWADGQLLDTDGLTIRFYRGSEDQLPDSLIEATQRLDAAPGYRGLCYMVLERLPLSRFGNRIPSLSVELCRVVGELEPAIRAVTVIPGATEFGYDPKPQVRMVSPGRTQAENTHMSLSASDWSWSIDELMDLCPNLEHVALVIAWFGDDLRCGQCTVSPRVESASRTIKGTSWGVAGLDRDEARVVSSHGGGPAYGGTPSDNAVLGAIADLKARGIAVTLYPIILMDVPEGNALPDPYGGATQPAYSWRGRITCDPASGQPGSPDQSGVAATQVAAFANGGFGQMVRHYAGLAAAAGGVDAFLIGSEMRGLTTLRGPANSFPFVDVLVDLAAEVRAIVGPSTKITYAADWSEYSGYQPNGERFFHLDPLWASPAIDAVGIDNYMPLADWRDGTSHADAALSAEGYDLDYLMGNVAGGEGYDWYYASDAERLAGVRTPITDGVYNELWVWRFKDVRGWWSHWHHNRPGGVRQATPTAWVPGSKPIWFTELGCGAVDKGANQPNIFGDEKSDESGRPYFSSGTPDPLIQRQFLRAHQRFWSDGANNPAGMVDLGRIYHWTWDARPYPAFPAQTEVWADGPNHRTGHWLTGRLGSMASDELAQAVAREHGVDLAAAPARPMVHGYVLGDVGTGRDGLAPLIEASGLSLRDGQRGLALDQPRRGAVVVVGADGLVRDDGPVLSQRRDDPGEIAGRLALSYIDRERDYLTGTVTALRDGNGPLAVGALPLVLDAGGARFAAEQGLSGRAPDRQTVEFALPPSALALEPGDVVRLGESGERLEITEIKDGLTRQVTARTIPAPVTSGTEIDQPRRGGGAFAPSVPVVMAAHLPGEPGDPLRSRIALAGFADPWPGSLVVRDDGTGATLARLPRRGVMGEIVVALDAGPTGVWDMANAVVLELYGGHLASLDEAAVLAGANRLAVQTDAGAWEIIGFATAELVGPSHYRLTKLLRGQDGTGAVIGPIGAGRPAMLLGNRAVTLAADSQWLGDSAMLRVFAGNSDVTGIVLELPVDLGPLLPLAPVHVRARRVVPGGDIRLDWVRCSRADSDGWAPGDAPLEHMPERYRVQLFDGGAVVHDFETTTPGAIYAAAQQMADFGGAPDGFAIGVCQISPVFGAGHTGAGAFHD